MNKTTKLYNRVKELYESLWDGVKNIPSVLDFKFSIKTLNYISTGNASILYTLDDNLNYNNILVGIDCFKETIPYYNLCIYRTKENDLSKVHPVPVNDFGAYFDRVLSMRIFNDFTKIIYSDGLKAEDINEYILNIEKMIATYLEEHHCSEVQQINIAEEIKRLEEMS